MNYVFILAGGSGTRLAPLSLTSPGKLPKQFLALVGDKTMLQETIARIPAGNKIVIVPEQHYAAEVLKQGGANCAVLAEPFGCNTAPAIGLSALYTLEQTKDENTILFFMPADHIMDTRSFQKYFKLAVEQAEKTDKIITIGITPSRAETGYGYIKVKNKQNIAEVAGFVEKPDQATAEKYLADGNYFWNAGIFCMKIKTILQALQKDAPGIYAKLTPQPPLLKKEGEQIVLTNSGEELIKAYTSIKQNKQNISIDYAVMEKEADNMLLIRAGEELEWNDVGGWVALAKYNKPDNNNNLIFNYLGIKLALRNCRNLLVIASANGILITTQELGQRAKEIIPGIASGKTTELIDSPDTSIENTSTLYLGTIGLAKYKIFCSAQELSIEKL